MTNEAGSAGVASFWKLNKASVTSDNQEPKYLVVGEILRPHGVRGELRMRVKTDRPEQLPHLRYVYLGDSPRDPRPLKRDLLGLRFNKEYALLSLPDCRDRSEAELLRDKVVLIDREQVTPLNEGEYYLYQLIGLKVVVGQVELGHIKEVLQTGANDVYVVQGERFGEVLVPAHDETITSIDFAGGLVTMTLPDGLLPPA